MKLGNTHLGSNSLFFVVEEGMANMGNVSSAYEMIDAASCIGADAVEFQFYQTDDFCTPYDRNYQLYQNWELSIEKMKSIVEYTRQKKIECIVAPLTIRVVEEMTTAGCTAFNINGTDLTNPDIIDAVCASGVPFFLSLIIASENEIEWAVSRIEKRTHAEYCLLHGQHTMFSNEDGSAAENTSLGRISYLKNKYRVPVGYIDHSKDIWMPAAAAAAGADVVTKHMSLNVMAKGPDWFICLEPPDMIKAIEYSKRIKRSLADKENRITDNDKDKIIMRKSIIVAHDLPAGHIIGREDLGFKRPGTGCSPIAFEIMLGKRINKELKKDEQININDLEER